ncbi:MAG: MFS transporter [Chloroflexi bacterium]|nr:MFS transporter [Chloroflexota bacterium]
MANAQANDTPLVARPGAILALICLPVFIGSLDLTVISAVLPNVILDLRIPFQSGADDAAWMVNGYLLGYTISVALMGRVSDLIGRRRTYFIALLIFILGSWLVAVAAFAPTDWFRTIFRTLQGGRPDTAYMTLYALIGGRVIQALGAGAMVPVSMAMAGDLYPPSKRAIAIGIVGAVDTAGWVLGHLYGGVMVQFVDWQTLFWINIPITTAVALITWNRLQPVADLRGEGDQSTPANIAVYASLVMVNLLALFEVIDDLTNGAIGPFANRLLSMNWLTWVILGTSIAGVLLTVMGGKRIEERGRINWLSITLISLALFGLNIGLGGGDPEGARGVLDITPFMISALIIGAGAFIGFIMIEQRAEIPLFNFAYFQRRNVTTAAVANLFVGFCLMVGLVSVPIFVTAIYFVNPDAQALQASLQVEDFAALLSGILLGTFTVPMALASAPGGWIAERIGYRIPTAAGMLLAGVGFFLARTWEPEMALWVMSLHMAIAGIGLGLTIAPIATAVINQVSEADRGVASALVLVMRLIGMALGTSIMTSYGLRRSNVLTEQLGSGLTLDDTASLLQVSLDVAAQVINEMMLIAVVVCAVTLIPALLMNPRDDTQPGDRAEFVTQAEVS